MKNQIIGFGVAKIEKVGLHNQKEKDTVASTASEYPLAEFLFLGYPKPLCETEVCWWQTESGIFK